MDKKSDQPQFYLKTKQLSTLCAIVNISDTFKYELYTNIIIISN